MHDRELFERDLAGFVPPGAFDFHAHLFQAAGIAPVVTESLSAGSSDGGFDVYRQSLREWMGDLAPSAGLFFGLPRPGLDVESENRFVAAEVASRPGSRGLMVVRPSDDPAEVDSEVARRGWAGFKPYHIFAACADTFEAAIEEYLPAWAWEIADRRSLLLMVHLVRRRALADEANLKSIRDLCARFPNARLILAHAGRGFCYRHTIEGIDRLRGLDNVFFDTSSICESPAFEAVLRTFGPERLLFGTDFPVCEFRGRCVTVGDGFLWLDRRTVDWTRSPFAQPVRIGVESLLALRQACRTLALSDAAVERIFLGNARALLPAEPTFPSPAHEHTQAPPRRLERTVT